MVLVLSILQRILAGGLFREFNESSFSISASISYLSYSTTLKQLACSDLLDMPLQNALVCCSFEVNIQHDSSRYFVRNTRAEHWTWMHIILVWSGLSNGNWNWKFNFEIRENTGHGRTVLWFGQDFLIGRPVQRPACKMYVLPIFEGLSCVQR